MLCINFFFFPKAWRKTTLKECRAVKLHVNFCCLWGTKVLGKPNLLRAEEVLGVWASFLHVQYWFSYDWVFVKEKCARWMLNMAESRESEYFTCCLSCWPLQGQLLRQCPFISADQKPHRSLDSSGCLSAMSPFTSQGLKSPPLPLQAGVKNDTSIARWADNKTIEF